MLINIESAFLGDNLEMLCLQLIVLSKLKSVGSFPETHLLMYNFLLRNYKRLKSPKMSAVVT